MNPRAYVETTIVSYLSGLPSRDLLTAAHQQVTRDWWAKRDRFDLFVSQLVLDEASGGDALAARRRLADLVGLPILDVNDAVTSLAQVLIASRAIPAEAGVDALHVATATVHGMDYLVTWNCRHIANARMRHRIEAVCRSRGLEPPTICTPEELLEE
ncbi:MAG: type II toxin-antitoxin system VapC family toxin [Planctomycetota bacterium]